MDDAFGYIKEIKGNNVISLVKKSSRGSIADEQLECAHEMESIMSDKHCKTHAYKVVCTCKGWGGSNAQNC